MDERTLKALLGSIAKWEAIVAGTGEDHASLNCPLCVEFLEVCDPDWEPEYDESQLVNGGKQSCHGCPVKARTGASGCRDTPYVDWAEAQPPIMRDFIPVRRVQNAAQRALAQAELDFLLSLLPQAEIAPSKGTPA